MRLFRAAQLILGLLAAVFIPIALKVAILPADPPFLQSQLTQDGSSGKHGVSVWPLAPDGKRILKRSAAAIRSVENSKPGMGAGAKRVNTSTSVYRAVVPLEQLPKQHLSGIYEYAHKHGDLPTLANDRSPDNEAWDNGIAICACMFQENTTDIREWLLYHRWLGVDHVYLTENSKDESMVPQLQEFIDEGFVTFGNAPRPLFQQTIYLQCMEEHRHKHNWMAFLDLDEYLVLRKEGVTLKEFLHDFRHEAALVVHWVVVGPSHRDTRPAAGGVLRSYRSCRHWPSPIVKSITNTFKLANICSSPHTFEYRNNQKSVDEHRRPMPWRYELPKACKDGTVPEPKQEIDCRPVPAVQKKPASVDNIAVFHYITKSQEDFELKSVRGGGGGSHRTWEHFNRVKKDARHKGGLCDDAFKVADACCDPARYVAAT